MTDHPEAARPHAAEGVADGGLLSMQALANQLAADTLEAVTTIPPRPIQAELEALSRQLQAYHTHFQQSSAEELTLSFASEWVLDNHYILRQAAQQVREDLPPGYLRELPRLAREPWRGYPRVYRICRAYLIHQHYVFDVDKLEELLHLYQQHVPLTTGELWAIPIFLRFALLDALVQALALLTPSAAGQDASLRLAAPALPLEFDIPADDVVAAAVSSLRVLSDQDWKDFIETVNRVDAILRQDPAGAYTQMDFLSRDLYRGEVERLSRRSGLPELEVALAVLSLASQSAHDHPALLRATSLEQDARPLHVGYYLIDDGREQLVHHLELDQTRRERLDAWAGRNRSALYLGATGLLALLVLAVFARLAAGGTAGQVALAVLLGVVPALTVATHLVNWLLTVLRPPRMLPKLEREEIPDEESSLIAVPAILSSPEEVDSLLRQLELHHLRNPSPNIRVALLSDFPDADSETMPGDAALVERARAGVERLNERYALVDPRGGEIFYLLHRRRQWNPAEGKWMGWERKRGKLHEMNDLLRGRGDPSFLPTGGDMLSLRSVRYVITLDADTVLPLGAAARLIGTLAHPLNRAVFHPGSGLIAAGYSILQPRVEIGPRSANRSNFSRIYAGDSGLDLYTLAVSDVYQDTFGEGIYVGKGIYDVDAFERSLAGQVPENTLLSHDLLEGLLGRAALATDITMVEDYPDSYFVFARRLHRWIRGDWQLLPWLLRPRQAGGRLTAIDLWKIADNLRRSLLAPALMALFAAAWAYLPGSPWAWAAAGALTISVPMVTSLAHSLWLALTGHSPVRAVFRPLRQDLLRLLLAVVFLPFEALNALDAVWVTLYRLTITRRKMLEWTTAASTTRVLRRYQPSVIAWVEMTVSVLVVLGLGAFVALMRPQSLPPALPLLVLWAAAPVVAVVINRAPARRRETLNPDEIAQVRAIARRTWSFFEQFVGPEDHWLPPDHFQESPVGQVAHRTSPTNIGLLLASTLGAFELGYIDQHALSARLQATFETLNTLPRYRGHILNWLDTRTLQPLNPRYISTVDSGNLAACLILTAQSLDDMHTTRVFRRQRWEGILDTMGLLEQTLSEMPRGGESPALVRLMESFPAVRAEVQAAMRKPERWFALYQKVSGPVWQDATRDLADMLRECEDWLNTELLRRISQASQQVEQHFTGVQRTLDELVPWVAMLEAPPAMMLEPEFRPALDALRQALPYSPAIGQIGRQAALAEEVAAPLRSVLGGGRPSQEKLDALEWLDRMVEGARRAGVNSAALLEGYDRLAIDARCLAEEMDFQFLYDTQRRVFSIGYNLDAARLDPNFYDLLASEARISSLLAIAKGDVPSEHWLYLNRPTTLVDGLRVLLSWSATMFEYLMPPLFLRTYPNTLLEQSAEGAVLRQIEYGREKGVPWGVSESGFYRFDANQNYQYRAFGVPGLGFKRGLADDLVIAPYASLMAISYQPRSVVRNAARLADHGVMGRFGFYEAVDFTENRLAIGQEFGIVRSYMAHHQGMIMMALVDYLKDHLFVNRMHADPRIRSVELLLQEQSPLAAPLQNPESEDVRGTARLMPEAIEVNPWSVPLSTPVPQANLLANGSMTDLITQAGSGYLRWQQTDLTRFQPDGVLDRDGIWVYARDLDLPAGGDQPLLWSVTPQPLPQGGSEGATFHPHMVVYRSSQNGIDATLEVTLPGEDALEIRRLYLSNPTDQPRRLRLDSYGEVILTDQANDARHPAFNKLFIQNEYIAKHNLLLFRRRPRSATEAPIFLAHSLLVEGQEESRWYETDRKAFIGRGQNHRSPDRLLRDERLSSPTGESGLTLDPIFSLGQEVILHPHQTLRLAWLTGAADSSSGALEMIQHYRNWAVIDRAFHQARIASEARLRKQEIDGPMLRRYLELLSALLYPLPSLRAAPETIAANHRGQSGLWPFGISGDYPILLVRIADTQRLELVREALQAHRYYRERGMQVDLVVLNEQQSDYGAEMNRLLYRLIARTNSDNWLNQRGGVFVLYTDQMKPEERTLLLAAARVVLSGELGSLADQLPGYSVPTPHLPALMPSRPRESVVEETPPLPPLEPLLFPNGYGGFTPDGREYVIEQPPGAHTPLPWSNVVGYPGFGFLVTEAGSSTTWAANSGENRLTPWSNDPVSDASGEALYLRDEETGEVWTPTPLPAGEPVTYRARHGAGYSQFDHHSHGLRQRLRLYADPHDPVKLIHLRLENTWDRPRRITCTQYAEWVLGTQRWPNVWHMLPEFLPEQRALLAANPYSMEFPERVAFLAASKSIHSYTADRMEFLGRGGSRRLPIALTRIGLEGRVTAGEHPCAALQVHVDLAPGQVEELYFVLGQGDDRAHSLELIDSYTAEGAAGEAWQRVSDFWEHLLSGVQVRTPDPAMDLLLNRWLLYQTLSCRIWGRTAFYQSSGAFGFRDQLQDVMSVLLAPGGAEIARKQILNAAAHQFEAGDALHWWHPPSGRGVRTRISDDLLWLPYVVSEYVRVTGDAGILQEEAPFLQAAPLQEGEEERYGHYPRADQPGTIFEHCRRAVERGSTRGPHGLPLIGTGDWNDGMNRVGVEGQGESVWLAWFLYETLQRFAGLCEAAGQPHSAPPYLRRAEELKASVEEHAWDGEWYLRAYFDSGAPLGSRQNRECQIDSIAQSWSVLSGAGQPGRARQAMEAVNSHLVRPDDRLVLLFTPPFDTTPRDPGYIKGYLPGIRENGGQYTHAATWTAWAFAALGEGERAGELFKLLNPVYHTSTRALADVYQVEPYVVAADVYSMPPHVRRGGWTWYTGSAGWLYRLGLEAILGLRREGDALVVNPVLPPGWDEVRMAVKLNGSTYRIHVANPGSSGRGVASVRMDGLLLEDLRIPLTGASEHVVEVLLGGASEGSN